MAGTLHYQPLPAYHATPTTKVSKSLLKEKRKKESNDAVRGKRNAKGNGISPAGWLLKKSHYAVVFCIPVFSPQYFS